MLGIALLVVGLMTNHTRLRQAALGVMCLTSVKVFLIDTGELTDLYRVGSFLGLGISLLALAYLYHRFVIAAEEERAG